MNNLFRYSRNLQLPDFTEETQQKLGASRVLIVGAGALGSVVGMYLAASGIGNLIIADFDNIDVTNLQRQVFYCESDVGESKTAVLVERIRKLNSGIKVKTVSRVITSASIDVVASEVDAIVECSDNPATKEMIVSAGKRLGIPVVLGGVKEYFGQVMIFNPDSPDYTDIFPSPECSPLLPCGGSGVFGPVPGIVGCMQAAEVIKITGGLQDILKNTILAFDLRTMEFNKFSF